MNICSTTIPSMTGPRSSRCAPFLGSSRCVPCLAAVATIVTLLLAGCATGTAFPNTTSAGAAVVLSGKVHGGQQPVAGATLQVYQNAISAYGAAATALITPGTGGLGSTGYVPGGGTCVVTALNASTCLPLPTTDANGNFSITGDYTCTSGYQVYVLATGGNSGSGTNADIGLMAGLGACPASGTLAVTVPTVFVDEVSTVATAYALAGFFADATHLATSGSALATTGINNAAANIAAISSITTGNALTTTPNGQGAVPQAEIDTLANVLASCINSNGSTCAALFALAKNGSVTPTETATAAINIAHNPGTNATALFGLVTATGPFQPALSTAPNDFSLAIQYVPSTAVYSASGALGDTGSNGSLAVDAGGNVWGPGSGFTSVIEISPQGAELKSITLQASAAVSGNYAKPLNISVSPAGTIWAANYQLAYAQPTAGAFTVVTDGSANYAGVELAAAFDTSNDVWTANNYPASFGEFSPTGSLLVTTGYEPGGFAPLSSPATYPSDAFAVAVDSGNHIWGLCNQCSGSSTAPDAAEITSNGIQVSGATGDTASTIGYPSWIAIDRNNDAWISSFNGYLTEYSSSSTLLSSTGYPTSGAISGGLNSVAVDGNNIIWAAGANNYFGALFAVNSSGSLTSPATGYQAPGPASASYYTPSSIAIDGSGNIWALDYNGGLHETIGIATPVVTPITASALGQRP